MTDLGSGLSASVVHTIGHGTRTADDLIRLLHTHALVELVDVRTIPRSRHNPQFNRETLPVTLAPAGIGYVHLAGLGGLRRPRPGSINTGWRNAAFRGYADYMHTPEFEAALNALIKRAAAHRLAMMCAETVPWRCHRSLIADALAVRAISVVHILGERRAAPHTLTPWARAEGTRLVYPAAPPYCD